ncbi:MAG: RodZ domain-containing protein [Cyanobacteria bacterium P01_H01_bin.121]
MIKRQKRATINLEELQAQCLSQLGGELRSYRESQSKSLEQIAAKTRIQRRQLQAIEHGQLTALPEPVYVRGLLRRFADELGLEGMTFAERFPLELPTNQNHIMFWGNLTLGQLRPAHLYALYILIVFSAINGLSLLIGPSLSRSTESAQQPLAPAVEPLPAEESTETAANPPQSDQADTLELSAVALPSPTTAQTSGPLQAAFPLAAQSLSPQPSNLLASLRGQLPSAEADLQRKPVEVILKLTDQSWLRVTVDGQTDYEGIMLAGNQRKWVADQEITVRAGNAGSVIVSHNNSPEKRLGEPGAVEEATFAAEQIVSAR